MTVDRPSTQLLHGLLPVRPFTDQFLAGHEDFRLVDAVGRDQSVFTEIQQAEAFAAVRVGLAQQGGGFVGNVSSMAAFDPFPGFAAYAPAKAAVNMLTLVTAREGAAWGVAALAVAPGAVETPMLRGLFDASVIPPGKTLDPADVAAVLTAAALGQRDFISGSVVELPSPA